MLRILIADDHVVLRKGVKEVLSEEFPQAEFQVASTMGETLEALHRNPVDLLVLDFDLPGGGGFGVLHEIGALRRRPPALILGGCSEAQIAVGILRSGASGYLNGIKVEPDQLKSAARTVLGGGRYLSPALSLQLALHQLHGNSFPHKELSAREFQVFRLIVGGHSVKCIGGELSLSVKTVRTYRARLLRKLRLQTDVELVRYAFAHGLVENNTSPQLPPFSPQEVGL
jgi:DNA-binding NarL/FixJ family response regulator